MESQTQGETVMRKITVLINKMRKYIGLRTIKTVAAVLFCFIIYDLRGRQGIPFYSALSAIWCIRSDVNNSKSMAWQRTVGTLIGVFYGLVVLLIQKRMFPNLDEVSGYLFATLFLIPLIITTVLLKKQEASFFSCAVFLSITINHLRDSNPYLFVWNRLCDTMIGIVIALAVNLARIPYKRNRSQLFVSGLDAVLLTDDDNISDYSKHELNRMLDSGMHFTIATRRTPASLIRPLKDIRIRLPVIAMDGAVLFSIKEKAFLKKYPLKADVVNQLTDYFQHRDLHCFINCILEDTVLIYYGEFRSQAEKDMFQKLKTSPYRNYVKGSPKGTEEIIYLTLLLENQAAEQVNTELAGKEFSKHIRWNCHSSDEYPGYSLIRIYDWESGRQKMVEYLKKQIGVEKSLFFSSLAEGPWDVYTGETAADDVVRLLRRYYEPILWHRK